MCECPVRSRTVKVGSGSTELAKIHTSLIVSALKESHPDVEFEVVTTDSLQDKLSKASNLQTVPKRKSDLALLLGEVDCVVSSLKDVPIKLHQGLVIGCVFKRESPYDVVVLHPKYKGQSLESLPNGSVLGTSSLRRSAQQSGRYTHLKFEAIKGSLNDRFRKLDEDDSYAGLILAEAGLVRMGWQHRISERLPRDICMYALCQGAIGVKCREQDSEIINLLQPINDKEAALQCIAERSFFKNGNLSYKMPVSVFSEISSEEIKLSYGAFSTVSDKCKIESIFQKCDAMENSYTSSSSKNSSDTKVGIVPPRHAPYSILCAADTAGQRLATVLKADPTTQQILSETSDGQ